MDAATAGVLRDVALWVMIAIAIGATAYNALRFAKPALAWNWSGHVDARQYQLVDAGVVAIVLSLLLGTLGGDQKPDAEAYELSAGGLLSSAAFSLLLCIVLLVYLRVVRGLNPVELFGLRPQGILSAIGLACLFILPTIMVVNFFSANVVEWMSGFWPSNASQELVEGFHKSNDLGAKGMLVFTAVIIAPLFEELFFRGFIYGVIKRYTDSYFAAVCSALLFATVHLHMASFFPLALLALVLCLAYEVTGCLLAPMVMHGLFNATSIAVMIYFGEAPRG